MKLSNNLNQEIIEKGNFTKNKVGDNIPRPERFDIVSAARVMELMDLSLQNGSSVVRMVPD